MPAGTTGDPTVARPSAGKSIHPRHDQSGQIGPGSDPPHAIERATQWTLESVPLRRDDSESTRMSSVPCPGTTRASTLALGSHTNSELQATESPPRAEADEAHQHIDDKPSASRHHPTNCRRGSRRQGQWPAKPYPTHRPPAIGLTTTTHRELRARSRRQGLRPTKHTHTTATRHRPPRHHPTQLRARESNPRPLECHSTRTLFRAISPDPARSRKPLV